MAEPNWQNRTLFHGDNLEFMRAMNSESVDLIATDPPFNKSKDFHATPDSLAAGATFQDRWSWDKDVHEEWTDQLENTHKNLYLAIQNARHVHSDSMGAYLCFMAVRLIEMRRLLKSTGSIYLHCDHTASHYLKMIMDAVFGRKHFKNEIVWCYKTGGVPKSAFARKHDVLLFYSKDESKTKFNEQKEVSYNLTLPEPHTQSGKDLGVKRDSLGKYRHVAMRDWWVEYGLNKELDITPLYRNDQERFGFPTQKPIRLYERIIYASTMKGDIVLDPFCGCATTPVVAERSGRRWVGIDIWKRAQDAIVDRLEKEGLKAPKYTRKTKKTRQAYLFTEEFTFTSELPERTDNEDSEVVVLPTLKKALKETWQKLSNREIRSELEDAQKDKDDWIICAGCGRQLEGPFMELDHIMPKSSRGVDDISNRILLCSPCNGRKSNNLTLVGLRKENRKIDIDWMFDEQAAQAAEIRAHNKYVEVASR